MLTGQQYSLYNFFFSMLQTSHIIPRYILHILNFLHLCFLTDLSQHLIHSGILHTIVTKSIEDLGKLYPSDPINDQVDKLFFIRQSYLFCFFVVGDDIGKDRASLLFFWLKFLQFCH